MNKNAHLNGQETRFKKGYDSRRDNSGRKVKPINQLIRELKEAKKVTYKIEYGNGIKKRVIGQEMKSKRDLDTIIAVVLIYRAAALGELDAIIELIDRLEGKPKKQIDTTKEEIKVFFE